MSNKLLDSFDVYYLFQLDNFISKLTYAMHQRPGYDRRTIRRGGGRDDDDDDELYEALNGSTGLTSGLG